MAGRPRVLQDDRRPTAIFGVNDLTAFGVLNAAESLDLRVPEDLWVVGFDDVSMASWERFDLTTVRQPNDEIAQLAVLWLLERISGQRSDPRRHRFPCDLRVRGSTAHVPDERRD